ncbi:MAG: pyridoxal phosphate-dependent aminotransferase family protein [Verrucomicrobiota bacterium]
MQEAEPLQQVHRTYVRYRGRTLSYFGGCDYFRLASHPKILAAVREGMQRYGLNVAASRMTTGNHEVYVRLENELAQFFGAETALLTNSGYVTNLLVAQALAGQFSHVLIDERAHAALNDAVAGLNCPVFRFKHRDVGDFSNTLKRCGAQARPIVLTDGMFSHNGSVAPLAEYLKLLPRDGLIVVDDAHGAGTLGATGQGTIEVAGISRARIVQNITLSKAFGVYGGAIICSKRFRRRLTQGRLFVGSTPLPPPLAYAAIESIRLLKTQSNLRNKLIANSQYVKTKLRALGFPLEVFPGPIVPVHLKTRANKTKLKAALLRAGILPALIHYPGAPAAGYYRFVISSEHTRSQLDNLALILAPFAKRLAP